ncbi:MAG TPA: hypothetical protein VLH80_02160 [Nitrospiraceae bacterium]|jgi:hypothetical protein|nr:hypothetical protein [Nitrospiraceae bacterium]
MDGDTLVRLHELLTDIDAGRSPLTKQDIIGALRLAMAVDDAGDVVNWSVILATLEARLTKQEG